MYHATAWHVHAVPASFAFGSHGHFAAMTTMEPPQQASKPASQAKEEFIGVYGRIRDEVIADPMISQADAKAWMARMMDYNVPGGKLNRGMSVKDTLLAIDKDASSETRFQADCLGWAIEFLQVRACWPARCVSCKRHFTRNDTCRHTSSLLMISWTNQ